jgi:hypothetical protein
MEVVAHDGIAEDINPKDPGEFFESVADPFFPVGIVFARPPVLATEVGAPDTPIDEMKYLHFRSSTDLGSIESRHR